MKKLIARMLTPYGANRTNDRPTEERRWVVKVFPKGAPALYVAELQLPFPRLPMHGWVEPSMHSLEELPRYFRLTEKVVDALLFECPQDALQEAFKVEEFGVEADIVEADPFGEETELVVRSKG